MTNSTRRTFLGTTAAGTMAIPRLVYGAAKNRTLKAGLIGCGWYGMVDVKAALKVGGVEMIAVCDVDSEHLKKSADEIEKLQGTRPKTFKDYRDLLETKGLDILIIASPPHWHALQFIAGLEKGLDIYCEKPLAYDIREGRAMVDAAKKSGRIVQIGFQRRQSNAIQEVKQYIQDGKPGRIVQVDAQIHYFAQMKDHTPQNPPPSLDWDAWCGPGPKIPYSPQVGHFAWRLEKDSGHGHLVDWGIHLIDATRLILGESMPTSVQASGGNYKYKNQITTPDSLTAHFEFDRCPVVWRHRIWGAKEYTPEINNGILFFGEKETIFVTDSRWEIISGGKKEDRQVITPEKGNLGVNHIANFLEAVRSRKAPLCVPEDGYRSTATVQLAMIAYETGTNVVWDAKTERISDNPAASKLLKRDYRSPWKHPYQD